MNRGHIRAAFVVLLIGITIAVSTLVVISPLALRAIALIPNISWPELGNTGQTYGAVSALLAALALVGVAASVLMQNRELRHSRWESGRARHFEIIRMALDDPLYRQVYGARGMPENEARLEGYVNLLLEYWAMLWEFGDIQEEQLRTFLRELLGSRAGHVYWRKFGSVRLHEAGTKRERAFQRIADEVYRELAQSLPNGTGTQMRHTRLWNSSGTILGGGLLIALVAACVALLNRAMARKGSRPLRPAKARSVLKSLTASVAFSGPAAKLSRRPPGTAGCRYRRPQTGPWMRDVQLAVYTVTQAHLKQGVSGTGLQEVRPVLRSRRSRRLITRDGGVQQPHRRRAPLCLASEEAQRLIVSGKPSALAKG